MLSTLWILLREMRLSQGPRNQIRAETLRVLFCGYSLSCLLRYMRVFSPWPSRRPKLLAEAGVRKKTFTQAFGVQDDQYGYHSCRIGALVGGKLKSKNTFHAIAQRKKEGTFTSRCLFILNPAVTIVKLITGYEPIRLHQLGNRSFFM